jgi:hypothetical protein
MMNSLFGIRLATALPWATVCALAFAGKLLAADPLQTEISNGQLRVKLYLPDAKNGYYRGTRFDWSGVIASLEYKGHNFYGPWFDRMDPEIHDFDYVGAEVVAGPCTAALGPVEEFQTNGKALGWDEAKPGGTFIKIGVGALRKDSGDYDAFKLYDIVDAGQWKVEQNPDSVLFTQELSDPSSGYAYIYSKTVRLTEGKPEMVLEHRLKNTGRHTIQSAVYNHNFLVLDNQPPGPDFSISVPFQIHSLHPPDKDLAQIQGNQIVFSKVLENKDVVFIVMQGFGASPKDHDIRIENRKVGAGMRIRGDRPLSAENFWTMRRVLSLEPFIAMRIEPGGEFMWKTSYEYYTLPASTQ